MMFRPIGFAGTFLILALTNLVQAQEAPEKGVTIEGITEYRLANGCRCLLFPDPSSSNVTVNMTVLVGSRHEGYGETGMAHLLEHMVFKGAKNFPDIDKALQKVGAEFNGTTWTDRTNYYETMPASDENVEYALRMEADRLITSFIKREDLVKEMTVVRNEFENGENNPENILSQRMAAIAFEWHNYGKSTIGNRSDIERVPIENLQAFYRKYYQPDNVVVIVAGKFDEGKALANIAKHFGSIPRPKRVLPKTYTEEPAQDGERNVTLRRVGNVAVVGTMYHIPAASHPDNAAVEMLGIILADTPSGRLYKGLVETKKATSVSSDVTNWFDPGYIELTVKVADKTPAEEVRDLLVDLSENIAKNPITKEELERAQRKYTAHFEQAFTKSQRIAIQLSEWVGAGDWRMMFLHRDRIAKLTPEEVTQAAVKYLRTSNRTTGMFIPSKEVARTPIPTGPEVASIVKDYKGGKAMAQGETFDPTPENILGRFKVHQLSNGVKVGFLQKKTRGESVIGTVSLHYGNEKSLNGNQMASKAVGSMLMRGTKKHTRQELQDELDKLKSSLSVSSGSPLGDLLSVSIQSKKGQLAGVLDLMREVLREPAFPEKEFENVKRTSKQALQKSSTDPQALAFLTLARELNPFPKENIRYRATIEEEIERLDQLTLADVVKVYEEQVGGDKAEVVLIGDFDADMVLAKLEATFGNWKAKTPYERIAKVNVPDIKGTRKTLQIPDKEGAVLFAGVGFDMNDLSPDYAALDLGNHILGAGGFTSRLMDRLRQKDGLCYGAGSRLQVDSQDKVARLLVFAICNPENIDKVDSGANEEIRKIIKSGIPQEELDAARKGYLEEMKVDRGKDALLASMLRESLHLGRTFAYYSDLEKKVKELTPYEVQRALESYISADRLIVIRAGDFSKNKK